MYQHSKSSDAHSLLLKNKKALNCEYVLAKNDLVKDLPGPLQTKYMTRMSVLFSFEESPRDELFEEIKQTALDNRRITHDDITDNKLTDLDIVRLALDYQEQGKEAIIVTDDEGVHKLVKDLGKEEELEVLYTHLYFLKVMPYLSEKETKKVAENNVKESYYYLNNYLEKSDRVLPYEKVINTSINLLSKDYLKDDTKENALLQEKIEEYLESGKEDPKLKTIKPLLEIVRKRKVDPDYSTEKACLDLMTTLRKITRKEEELKQFIVDLVHRELASYHLELADFNHKELNLVGALSHIKSASQSVAFLRAAEETFEKTMDELLFIEALLLLELGANDNALLYLEQLLEGNEKKQTGKSDFRLAAEALIVIFEKKKGLIKEQSVDLLLSLVKEALIIPNTYLAKMILTKMLEDEKLNIVHKKKAAKEIIHLVNLRLVSNEESVVKQAVEILGKEVIDRTANEPDSYNLQKIQEDFTSKLAEPYRGSWEISEIREVGEKIWVYSWNERLKSYWVLDLPKASFKELEKAKTITFLSGKIDHYNQPANNELVKYRRRIVFDEKPFFVIDEKRALPLW
jgi:hypothetical protein